ncbi:hypothetical protein GPZ80_31530 [Actinokineospora sp. HBU206404]|uniref:Zinc finger protein n=1 Tax=Actinokineospora xionganensis TaxID=2684470 RepID=A0ABR7LGA7_9PSEU|nr:hypothetical protein [Actinokineospora xionganensis]
MSRLFEWQASSGGLHAIPSTEHSPFPPLPGAQYTTLCGLEIVLVVDDFRRRVNRPMCGECCSTWVRRISPPKVARR